MSKWTKIVASFLIVFFVLHVEITTAHADGLNGEETVKDCIKQKNCQDGSAAPEKSGASDPSSKPFISAWDIIKMIFALLFVLALLYGLLKFINKRSRSYQHSRLIENLGGTPLGGNRSIQLVKVNNRILILGVGENIQLLKDIDNQDEFSEILNHFKDDTESQIQPVDFLSKLLNGKDKKKDAVQTPNSSFKKMLTDQLQDFKGGRKKIMNELEKKEQDPHE
ncbi:flagellar biosynthetic protein FliO [Falsibacillus albus]|uniref:Flagellar biosynthesis protein FliZ n=1 Tax=Falsibacillus albus TaxID=2478915 RepID=A0A3L7JYA2_9BACI|nr:flagellar biosynthetic protein FliO [Falsibacillus albus]RLQ95733.1 flagellar biosynthesis protein FliZ [Falsibacillus albus]